MNSTSHHHHITSHLPQKNFTSKTNFSSSHLYFSVCLSITSHLNFSTLSPDLLLTFLYLRLLTVMSGILKKTPATIKKGTVQPNSCFQLSSLSELSLIISVDHCVLGRFVCFTPCFQAPVLPTMLTNLSIRNPIFSSIASVSLHLGFCIVYSLVWYTLLYSLERIH